MHTVLLVPQSIAPIDHFIGAPVVGKKIFDPIVSLAVRVPRLPTVLLAQRGEFVEVRVFRAQLRHLGEHL